MGYVAPQRIAATSNPNATPNVGARSPDAYRDISVYTGVPVDMSTSISNQVVDIGTVPHGFGLYTQSYATPTRLRRARRPVRPDTASATRPTSGR